MRLSKMKIGKRFAAALVTVCMSVTILPLNPANAVDTTLPADVLMYGGVVEIDGFPYLYAPDGVQQTGWQTVNGKRYYYHLETGEPVFGWFEWRDGLYYLSAEEGKAVGITATPDGLCCFDGYGVRQIGWATDADGNRCYAGADGILVTGDQTIDGVLYRFDETGRQCMGWQTFGDVVYYYNSDSGAQVFGWLETDGKRYYIDIEKGRISGEFVIDGVRCLFDKTGVQQLGWVTFSDGAVSYFDENGGIRSGITSIDGDLYCFSQDGMMQTGFQTIADAVYYFGENGVMCTGLVTIDGKQYAFDETGKRAMGWFNWGNCRYYCAADGSTVSGWQEIDHCNYYFNEFGVMQTGWVTVNGVRYYCGANGVRQSGILTIDGVRYAIGSNGVLCTDGWFSWLDGRYYCSSDGVILTGWQSIGTADYYFYDNGKLAVSTEIDGYFIDANGIAMNDIKQQVLAMLPEAGDTPTELYNYVAPKYRYRRIEETRTLDAITAAGWDTLVRYVLTNRRGVCYYLAANFDYFLQQAGYTTRLVYTSHDANDHYWCQVWVDGGWHNYDPTTMNRCDVEWNALLAAGNYRVNGYVTICYDNRGDYVGITYEKAASVNG